jgi:hypothetical protein
LVGQRGRRFADNDGDRGQTALSPVQVPEATHLIILKARAAFKTPAVIWHGMALNH